MSTPLDNKKYDYKLLYLYIKRGIGGIGRRNKRGVAM